ncbi:MAG: hypothetical protein KJ709_04930 [Nanoarchaeota archaeon]|nr:hypothetical protein [Nanoarchaeota archaeon]
MRAPRIGEFDGIYHVPMEHYRKAFIDTFMSRGKPDFPLEEALIELGKRVAYAWLGKVRIPVPWKAGIRFELYGLKDKQLHLKWPPYKFRGHLPLFEENFGYPLQEEIALFVPGQELAHYYKIPPAKDKVLSLDSFLRQPDVERSLPLLEEAAREHFEFLKGVHR